ncbi:MAG: hypothetical protein ACE5HE_05590 [Phycisphaerae bacterium]
MLACYFAAYPWDLIDEGVDAVLDCLQGEVGVDGLTVWAATPPVLQLRMRSVEPRVFRTDGGAAFQPCADHYTTSRCKPIVAEWVKTRNPLATIAEACAKRNLRLRARVSATLTGRLVDHNPHMASKSVFGTYSRASACLANPDVQEYLCGLATDLCATYGLSGLAVTDLQSGWVEAFSERLQPASVLGDEQRRLLSICSCESCYQKTGAAGVDLNRVLQWANTRLQRSLDAGCAGNTTGNDTVDVESPLADLHRWRAAELEALLTRISSTCLGELLLDIRGWHSSGSMEYLDTLLPIPAGAIIRVAGAEELPATPRPEARRTEISVPTGALIGTRDGEFVSMAYRAAEMGFSAVEIDHYGVATSAVLTTVKQAARFARRAT